MRRQPRIGSLAAELPIAIVEPDGLIVTTDGRYVRLIQCDRVPNAITADASQLARITDAFQGLCRIIPDRQSLTIYAQTDPVPIEDALAADERATEAAAAQDRADGHPELAQARERLFEATRQTVIAAAGAEQPAVSARWWVAVPYSPISEDPRRQLQDMAANARGKTVWATHRDAAIESARITEQVDGALRRAGIETWPLDGTQTLALLWERLHPAADELPDLAQLAAACKIADATTSTQAGADRHRILQAIAGDVRLDLGQDSNWVRHADGTLEEAIHLATLPQATDAAWLSYLLTCPLPATLAVHIEVGRRASEVARQRRRWQRLRAAVRYKERRDRLVGSDEEDALEEAAVVDAELAQSIGATVYRVGIYCAIRDPRGDPEPFKRIVRQTCADFHTLTNARVVRGRTPRQDRADLNPAARGRQAQGTPPLRAAQHRRLRRADLQPVRLSGRADPRDRRSRRHARAA